MRSRRALTRKQQTVPTLRRWTECFHRSRVRAAWLSAACALVVSIAFGGPTMASADPGEHAEAPTTATPAWSGSAAAPVAKGTHGAHPNAFVNQYCAGYFATPLVERDAEGRYYLHFGGYQQCAPNPLGQSVEFDLYKSNGTFVAEAYSRYQVNYMVTAYGQPDCANRILTTY